MYGCRHQLYLAANTNFSPILEILLANGLGGQLVRRLDLFCVRGRRGSRERRVVAESPAHTHTRSHRTVHMVAKLATYMEWPVATRLIDRLRECVLH